MAISQGTLATTTSQRQQEGASLGPLRAFTLGLTCRSTDFCCFKPHRNHGGIATNIHGEGRLSCALSRGWVSSGVGLGHEGPRQAGEDPNVAPGVPQKEHHAGSRSHGCPFPFPAPTELGRAVCLPDGNMPRARE